MSDKRAASAPLERTRAPALRSILDEEDDDSCVSSDEYSALAVVASPSPLSWTPEPQSVDSDEEQEPEPEPECEPEALMNMDDAPMDVAVVAPPPARQILVVSEAVNPLTQGMVQCAIHLDRGFKYFDSVMDTLNKSNQALALESGVCNTLMQVRDSITRALDSGALVMPATDASFDAVPYDVWYSLIAVMVVKRRRPDSKLGSSGRVLSLPSERLAFLRTVRLVCKRACRAADALISGLTFSVKHMPIAGKSGPAWWDRHVNNVELANRFRSLRYLFVDATLWAGLGDEHAFDHVNTLIAAMVKRTALNGTPVVSVFYPPGVRGSSFFLDTCYSRALLFRRLDVTGCILALPSIWQSIGGKGIVGIGYMSFVTHQNLNGLLIKCESGYGSGRRMSTTAFIDVCYNNSIFNKTLKRITLLGPSGYHIKAAAHVAPVVAVHSSNGFDTMTSLSPDVGLQRTKRSQDIMALAPACKALHLTDDSSTSYWATLNGSAVCVELGSAFVKLEQVHLYRGVTTKLKDPRHYWNTRITFVQSLCRLARGNKWGEHVHLYFHILDGSKDAAWAREAATDRIRIAEFIGTLALETPPKYSFRTDGRRAKERILTMGLVPIV